MTDVCAELAALADEAQQRAGAASDPRQAEIDYTIASTYYDAARRAEDAQQGFAAAELRAMADDLTIARPYFVDCAKADALAGAAALIRTRAQALEPEA